MGIRDEMPVLARHEGEWGGVYTHVNRDCEIIDQHQSHLTCRFPSEGTYPYHQTNRYHWPDGKVETFDFPALYSDKRIWWDTGRIVGSAWELDQNSVVLTWQRKDLPGASLYEMIQLSPCNNHRARTWHWFKDGILFKRTLISEERLP